MFTKQAPRCVIATAKIMGCKQKLKPVHLLALLCHSDGLVHGIISAISGLFTEINYNNGKTDYHQEF